MDTNEFLEYIKNFIIENKGSPPSEQQWEDIKEKTISAKRIDFFDPSKFTTFGEEFWTT